MRYILRDKNGVMRLRCSNNTARMILDESVGSFRSYQDTKMTKPVNAYEFKGSTKLNVNLIEIFVWEGDLLIPDFPDNG